MVPTLVIPRQAKRAEGSGQRLRPFRHPQVYFKTLGEIPPSALARDDTQGGRAKHGAYSFSEKWCEEIIIRFVRKNRWAAKRCTPKSSSNFPAAGGAQLPHDRETALSFRDFDLHRVGLLVRCCLMAAARQAVENLLRAADIEVNGARACDIQVHDERFFSRVLADGTLGFGESYMDGWWDCEALDEMCCRAIRARLEEHFTYSLRNLFALATSLVINRQTRRRSHRVGETHYDLGNDFFQAMLDPWMQYSCAFFDEGDDLAAAQHRKLELICQRLQLRPGLRLLDIGCGWGGLAKYAAENYGCSVVGLTISREQQEFAANWCRGLDVEIRLRDYREVRGTFDCAVSVGMVEHVGFKNYRVYLRGSRRIR